jgi:hypothetical protein
MLLDIFHTVEIILLLTYISVSCATIIFDYIHYRVVIIGVVSLVGCIICIIINLILGEINFTSQY